MHVTKGWVLISCLIMGGSVVLSVAFYGAKHEWFLRRPGTGAKQPAGSSVEASPNKEVREAKYVPPPVVTPELALFVDRDADAHDRVTGDIAARIPSVHHEEDVRAVVSVLMDTRDNDTVRNEAASLLARSGYKELANRLLHVLQNPKEGPRFRAFCIQHLWTNLDKASAEERSQVVSALHDALADKHVPVRREALLALVRERDSEAEGAAVRWLTSPDGVEVRDLAIRCIRELDLREHMPTVRGYVRDPDEPTKIAAIVALSQWGDVGSRPAFEEAAKSKSVRLQRAGRAALERLDKVKKTASGSGSPSRPSYGSPAAER